MRLGALLREGAARRAWRSNSRSQATFTPVNTKMVSSTASTRTGAALTPSPPTIPGAIATIAIRA